MKPRIYTKRGDDGTTGLLYGGRVPKDSRQIEVNGVVDEAQAALGLARAESVPGSELDDRLETPSMRTFTYSPLWNRPLAVQSWRAYLGPVTDPDDVSFIADDDQRREREPPAALDHLGDAVDLDDALLQVEAGMTY